MLVDINMPVMNGIELVAEIRRDKALRRAVIFILTTSNDERDISSAHDLNVTGYVTKDRVGEEFRELMGTLGCYWQLVEMPDLSLVPTD